MSIIFRRMRKEDAAAVAAVEAACFSAPWSRESFWQEAENARAFYILAEEEGALLGYAGCWVVLDEAQIVNIAVAPTERSRGIGRALLEGLLSEAKTRGAAVCTLEVRPSNAHAIALYESIGFAENGRRRKYYADNDEDAILMWKTDL